MTAVTRLLAGAPPDRAMSLDEHAASYGAVPDFSGRGEALVELVERSGLRGRGGADFPTAVKMSAVARGWRRPVVVANGVEGEPLSAKDKLLAEALPHLVIDGTVLAAQAVGAEAAFLCFSASARRAATSLDRALRERDDRVAVQLVLTPDTFVAGEESALVSFLDGRPAKPAFVPPRPYERGVRGRPTLVQNVETLAHLAQIARFGDDWFAECGTPADPGTGLVTVGGSVRHPGVYEIECGTALGEVVALAGGPTEPVQAFLVGGYFGSWFAAPDATELHLGHSRVREAGGSLGSGVIVALPQSVCALREAAAVMRYLAHESSGQCGPCRYGLDALATATATLARAPADPRTEAQLRRWSSEIAGRGACHHPDGAVRFLTSALSVFSAEVAAHTRGSCHAAGGAARVLPVPHVEAPA